jgi:two-component system, sensor histidine kinase and response regulator
MNALPSPSGGSAGSCVLVVDDIPKNLQVVGTLLRNAGYAIMAATSGAKALEGVRVQLPDLILLDLMMPEMDGLEVCRRLKADALTQAIPVIFLTASNEMEHLVKGFEMGAVDYVTKPFNPPELLARVRTHLELKHARDTIVHYGQELSRLNEEKNEFMGIAAHDLRNPLSAIKGYSEMMIEDAQALQHRELEENAGRVLETAARMAQMVQNLLDANRIERGEMQLRLAPAALAPAVSAVVETQRPRAEAKQQTLHWQNQAGAPQVHADSTALTQVIENLVSNAVKYSPPGAEIFVRLKNNQQAVRVEVQDQGPGLSAEDQKKLFGKFARLSAKPTGGEHSTGLGLSIVKKMVEAMSGKVWCETEPGRGATFIVEFPATPS